jgi:ABC-2 type transport system permease protein
MMSIALIRRGLRDYAFLLLILTAAAIVLEVALVRAFLESLQELRHLQTILNRPLLRTLATVALGADPSGDLTPTTLATIGLGHPVLYALVWTWLLTLGSGAISGEIGRGTADLLFTLPVRRRVVYASATVPWVLGAAVLSFVPLLGLRAGAWLIPLPAPFEYERLFPVAVNFFALNLSIGGAAMLISSLCTRRGSAVAIVLAGLLASDLMNFISLFWEGIRPLSRLGFLHYYRMLPAVRSAAIPWGDVAILLTFGAICWTAGLIWFARRDVPAA